MPDAGDGTGDPDILTAPGFQITSALLYHPDLEDVGENTTFSGKNEPSPFYLFRHHQSRMLEAIHNLPGNNKVMLQSISGPQGLEHMRSVALKCISTQPSKLRFTLDREGVLNCTSLDLGTNDLSLKAEAYFPSTLCDPTLVKEESITWLVSISSSTIRAQFATRHKTTARQHYALAMMDAPGASGTYRTEAIIVNEQDQIMEGCSTTPYFWRDGSWITPSASCGGNLGTTRKWALHKRLAIEGVIMRKEVHLHEIIVLSNAVRGFGFGKIVKN